MQAFVEGPDQRVSDALYQTLDQFVVKALGSLSHSDCTRVLEKLLTVAGESSSSFSVLRHRRAPLLHHVLEGRSCISLHAAAKHASAMRACSARSCCKHSLSTYTM